MIGHSRASRPWLYLALRRAATFNIRTFVSLVNTNDVVCCTDLWACKQMNYSKGQTG